MKPILEIQNISKRFLITHEEPPYLSIRERLTGIFKPKPKAEELWVLKDINFNVRQGESLGIIGRNGAGKSTLLKILSRITPPTSGRIITRGRIASLLEVGTGFHQELTGRENIYMNGSILGMKKSEINTHFDEIVDFSGTEKFLDTPLKHFSSGMQLRLAFAVAAHLEPEIMIIDEVLAVGDAEFQKKCLGKMEDVNKSGKTLLFVSHNMAAVANLCQHAILLDRGKLVKYGSVTDVMHEYQTTHGSTNSSEWTLSGTRSSAAIIKKIQVTLGGEQPRHTLLVRIVIISNTRHPDLFVAFDVSNSIGITIFQSIPNLEPFIRFSEGEQVIETLIELPPLIPDQYRISVWLGPHYLDTVAWEKQVVSFEITESPTPGRSFPHSFHNGFVVPKSRIVNG